MSAGTRNERTMNVSMRTPAASAKAICRKAASGPITVAGVTLASSFAMLALVPLAAFRQIAFALAAGVLIDTFIVRSFLVPALIALVGRASGWPSRSVGRNEE